MDQTKADRVAPEKATTHRPSAFLPMSKSRRLIIIEKKNPTKHKKFKTHEQIAEWEKENYSPKKDRPQLKLFPEYENGKAAMPNTIARSALFACVHPGLRKMHDSVLIASRKDSTIHYTGKQLDMGGF